MNWRKLSLSILMVLSMQNGFAWNALGHRLVAQIAYDQLTPDTIRLLERYNHALSPVFSNKSLVDAAPWLDSLRYQNELWLRRLHYIDIPFSRDDTVLKQPNPINAVQAIKSNYDLLRSKTSTQPFQNTLYQKGFSLRILLHVVADIHEPMHAVTEYSKRFPQGDLGGNKMRLGKNKVAPNLHRYWDDGAGFLKKSRVSRTQLKKLAETIEGEWPCEQKNLTLDPQKWSQESNDLARRYAYAIKYDEKPSNAYRLEAQKIIKHRLAQAGCRLAFMMNQLTKTS